MNNSFCFCINAFTFPFVRLNASLKNEGIQIISTVKVQLTETVAIMIPHTGCDVKI